MSQDRNRDGQLGNSVDDREGIVGPNDHLEGTYRSSRGLRVQGRVDGSIEAGGHVLIEDGANVTASIAAADVTVSGRYSGSTQCRNRFEVTPSGSAMGQIDTNLLVVREGGHFDGEITMKSREPSRSGGDGARAAEL